MAPERLLPLVAAWAGTGAYILLDEAFIDFVEEASLKAYLGRFPRLLILRSFTKFFGIPGMRLGYLLAAPQVIEQLAQVQEPWSVNTMAQAMGRACLRDGDFMARSRSLIAEERAYLFERLGALDGCRPFAGAVNYLLVKLTRPGLSAANLRKAMLAHRVLLRDASNFRGLDERFFRLAVRRRQENDRLLAALARCLEGD
jgi:threonine-phosphate decarboxylase